MAISGAFYERYKEVFSRGAKVTGTETGSGVVGMFPIGNFISVKSDGIYRLGTATRIWTPPSGYSFAYTARSIGYYKDYLIATVWNSSTSIKVCRIYPRYTAGVLDSDEIATQTVDGYVRHPACYPLDSATPYMVLQRSYTNTIAVLYTVNLDTGAVATLRDIVASDSRSLINCKFGKIGRDGYYYFETYGGSTYNYLKTPLSSYSATTIRSGVSSHNQGNDGLHFGDDYTSRIYNDARSTYWTFGSTIYDFITLGTSGGDYIALVRKSDGVSICLLASGGSLTETTVVSDTATSSIVDNSFRQGTLGMPGSDPSSGFATMHGMFWGNYATSQYGSFWYIPAYHMEAT